MKLKNIFLSVAFAGLLFSCVSEEMIDGPTPVISRGDDASFSLTLKMRGVETKAPVGENPLYQYATRDELDVSRCVIAIFKLDANNIPTDLVGYKDASGTNLVQTTVRDTLAYSITGIAAKVGKVRVVAIANSDLNNLHTYKTYAALKEAIQVTAFTSSFNAKTLVKVGEVNYELKVANQNPTIEIPMIQLAARVDLNIKVELPKIVLPGKLDFPTEVNDVLKYFGKTLQSEGDNNGKKLSDKSGLYQAWQCFVNLNAHLKNKGYTTYINPLNGQTYNIDFNGKIAEIVSLKEGGITADSIIETIQWGLKVNSMLVTNIQTQTPVLIEAKNLLPLLPSEWLINVNKTITSTYTTTFYTYQKELFKNDFDPEVLTVTIDAELVKGVSRLTKKYGISLHGIWVNGKTGMQLPGWSSSKDELNPDIFVPVANEIITTGTVSEDFIPDASTQTFARKFVLRINPKKEDPGCNTDGVIHGNLYSTDIIFRSVVEEVELQYAVIPWTPKGITIPDFK